MYYISHKILIPRISKDFRHTYMFFLFLIESFIIFLLYLFYNSFSLSTKCTIFVKHYWILHMIVCVVLCHWQSIAFGCLGANGRHAMSRVELVGKCAGAISLLSNMADCLVRVVLKTHRSVSQENVQVCILLGFDFIGLSVKYHYFAASVCSYWHYIINY